MPKLFSSRKIVQTLNKYHFNLVAQKGSHAKFRKQEGTKILTVIVPMGKKEIPAGTFSSILRQSQLKREDFNS